MALVRAERVLETSTTTGTGSLSLGGPVTGYRSFASVMSTNDTCYYAIVAVDSSGRPTGDWETGLGTLTASTTLTRTTVLASSNGGALVTLTSGTKQVFLTLTSTEIVSIVADIAGKAAATKVDVYSANDTWTKPSGAKFVDIWVIGGGRGGASGGLAASSTLTSVDATGGAAGLPGQLAVLFAVPADNLTGTVSVTVGAGGSGAASRTTTGTAVSGSSGGTSSFGGYLSAAGGASNATTPGKGGDVADAIGANGTAGAGGYLIGQSGTINNSQVIASGTAGVDVSTAGTVGTGASTNNATATGGTGGAGTTLTGGSVVQISSGGGGGGGAGVTSAGTATACIGGDGGTGGFPGGGGGGGGAAGAQRSSLPTGSKSGKGGDGGSGAVVVITHF